MAKETRHFYNSKDGHNHAGIITAPCGFSVATTKAFYPIVQLSAIPDRVNCKKCMRILKENEKKKVQLN